jgi:hypothetical protein
MKAATREWVRCAEEDFDVANALLRRLNDYAVKFRYPGHVATRTDAREALKVCRSIRTDVRLSIGLPRK